MSLLVAPCRLITSVLASLLWSIRVEPASSSACPPSRRTSTSSASKTPRRPTTRPTSRDVAGRGRTRDGRRQSRNDHRGGRTPAGERAAPPADQGPPRQRQIGDPPHLP